MHEGLYEEIVTRDLEQTLSALRELEVDVAPIGDAEQPEALARHIGTALQRRLEQSQPHERVALVNRLLSLIQARPDEEITEGPRELRRIERSEGPGINHRALRRPSIPLSAAALLTNGRDEPGLNSEIGAELESADRVDLLCAFIKWHGLRLFEKNLTENLRHGVPLRVITTTYMGATDPHALDRLVNDFGATVKIQFDSIRTRLHAKAWLFTRKTGFDTAYVGSSNLSRSAMIDGVEWNVRLSQVSTPALLEKFRATFESYWADPTFVHYEPARDREMLDRALTEARGIDKRGRVTISLSNLEVRAKPFQQEMLDALNVERSVHDRHRNLIVAATGTGKTVVAALDYRNLCRTVTPSTGEKRPSLLFVAHRSEILDQALRTYREVLGDPNFGETYYQGVKPQRWDFVFASVQSLNTITLADLSPTAFDVVVIDEFHHAHATTYRRLIDHFAPKELIGLTATPERADGLDVRSFFDGRSAVELRLWDALEADLLCPFHYFGIADSVDLSTIEWQRGGYSTTDLDEAFTGNAERARLVITQFLDKISDISEARALGFCVSVAHADYMAEVFRQAGIAAQSVTGQTSEVMRRQALDGLRDGTITVIFSVDLFNEGIDLPDIDTILLLRPTESATVFLQQLGRGLRQSASKSVLTVLDFVGHQRKEFRFDLRFRALTGATRRELERDIEEGFRYLPTGCQIQLDRRSQEAVLANLRGQLQRRRWNEMVKELRSYGDLTLGEFLRESGFSLNDVVRSDGKSWTELRRRAGLMTQPPSPRETSLLKRVRALAHCDDSDRASAYQRVLADDASRYSDLSENDKPFALMLFYAIFPNGGGFQTIDDGLASLRNEDLFRHELQQVIAMALDDAQHVPQTLSEHLAANPLRIHARYQREEILAALGHATLNRPPSNFREGVLTAPDWMADAFLITLRKSEQKFSPSTMYRDYPISQSLFHWETQSTTSLSSPTGRRYIEHSRQGRNILLFVREQNTYEYGTAPYYFLGPASYVEHRGDRPIAITWCLDHPIPTDLYMPWSIVAT
ncbi:DUF3427 domain-containing protein [Cryptosporangium sp. NPDC048952]|uniref:DUF3427 domain-containing protein n=1 Tax=Cryptosporangium sp. NPDC048952 TaxID=3363961 RepID=UPI0037126467